MELQRLLSAATGSRVKSSSRKVMAAARQARAEAVRDMISALVCRLRRLIANPRLAAKERTAADTVSRGLKARPDS